jgi:hypothetical protein
MRPLTLEEINQALDDNGEPDEGCIAIEISMEELVEKGTGTTCGHDGNHCFDALPKGRLVRGWYDARDNTMMGMIHIQCTSADEAEQIEELAGNAEGSLRSDGPSLWEGFWEFENE